MALPFPGYTRDSICAQGDVVCSIIMPLPFTRRLKLPLVYSLLFHVRNTLIAPTRPGGAFILIDDNSLVLDRQRYLVADKWKPPGGRYELNGRVLLRPS